MFRWFWTFLLCVAVTTSEPVCSRFHYEEQTLKKMIMVELLVEKMKTDLEQTENTVKTAIAEWKMEREQSNQQLNLLRSSGTKFIESKENKTTEITDSVKKNVQFRARQLKNLSPAKGDTLVFETTMANHGSGYDNTTGIFTAPFEGMYLFTLQLCLHNNNYIYFEMVADNIAFLKSLYIDDYTKWRGCYTTSAHTFLNAGQHVCIRSGRVENSAIWESATESWNMLSGVLLN